MTNTIRALGPRELELTKEAMSIVLAHRVTGKGFFLFDRYCSYLIRSKKLTDIKRHRKRFSLDDAGPSPTGRGITKEISRSQNK